MTADEDIRRAVAVLRRGGLIAYPTDTVWGLGCDASNPEAVARLYELKRRSDAKAMITLVADEAMLEAVVEDIPDAARQIIAVAVSPVTIVYDRPYGLAANLLAPDGSAGVRITTEEWSRRLCRALGRPVVSTSANFSGEPTARCFGEIDPELLAKVDYVAECGRNNSGAKASSVIKVDSHSRVTILRQ